MNPAQEQTVRETAAVAAAIAGLGGKATAGQVATATGLCLTVVKRRLHQSGPSNPFPNRRHFVRTGDRWGLTPSGAALVPAGQQTPRPRKKPRSIDTLR